MKRHCKRVLAAALALLLLFEGVQPLAAEAADGIAGVLDPAGQVELVVPESLRDGGNYIFFRQVPYAVSEKSTEKLYLPVQRTGNLDEAAEVTVKVIDMTARHGVNYELEIYRQDLEPEIANADVSVLELVRGAEEITEEELPGEAELGEILYSAGGADITDTEGNAIGTITATPVDADGNPLSGAQTKPQRHTAPDETEPAARNENAAAIPAGGPEALRAARNAYTGTASDRQELEQSDSFLSGASDSGALPDTADPSKIVEDAYPGREYRLRFEPGQQALFVVITPLYSEEADGDSELMLTLKNPSGNVQFPRDYGPVAVTIVNEDTPEPVVISLAEETVTAAEGEAVITVTRSGRLKSIAGVRIASWDGSARQGKDYGGVGAELYFPMGVTRRTIQLPVGHGTQEKDFRVTITPLGGEEIGIETARVVIPAAEAVEEEADLMAANGTKYGDEWNLKGNTYISYLDVSWHGDNGFMATTPVDKEWQYAGVDFYLPDRGGYFYDGMRIDHQVFANFCKARVYVNVYDDANGWHNDWIDDYTDEGVLPARQVNYYYGSPKSPRNMGVGILNRENNGWPWTDDYCDMTVFSAQPILRKFNISVLSALPLSFKGMTQEEVLKEYLPVSPNGAGGSEFSVWSGESFSISRPAGVNYPRLVGVEAVRNSDNATYRLATIDGKTDTVEVELTRDIVDDLGRNDFITWTADSGEGDPSYGTSYTGAIKVRPVFEHEDVTVEVRDTPYGVLKYAGKTLSAGTYTFHKGDRLVFEPNLSDAGMGAGVRAVGVGFISREDGRGGAIVDQNPCLLYLSNTRQFPQSQYPDGARMFTLTEDYYDFWQVFSEENNGVRVRVPAEELRYFDLSRGLFAGLTPETVQGYSVFTVKTNVKTNELTELVAMTADARTVPVWTLAGNTTRYSGSTFFFNTGALGEDNLVTLRADRDADTHAQYILTGSVYSSTVNLSTGLKAADRNPAREALIESAQTGGIRNFAITDQEGAFTMQAAEPHVGQTSMRYTVCYNGSTLVKETKLPAASAPEKTYTGLDEQGNSTQFRAVPVNVGAVSVDSYSRDSAHFASVSMSQSGVADGLVNAMKMNGQELTIRVKVDPGQGYLLDGQPREEKVTKVLLYFENQYTGERHGHFSSTDAAYSPDNPRNDTGIYMDWDEAAGTATLTITKFSPESPENWTYGDVLMAQLYTDKRAGVSSWYEGDMIYDPVSTGYAVYTDLDYVPETFSYNIESLAAQLKYSPDGVVAEDSTQYSFDDFPYLGEITAAVHLFTHLPKYAGYTPARQISFDLDEGDEPYDEDYEPMEDEKYDSSGRENGWAFSIYFTMKKTPYGGVRFLIGVAFTGGAGSGYKKQQNPYKSAKTAQAMFATGKQEESEGFTGGEDNQHPLRPKMIFNAKERGEKINGNFGGKYFTFGIYFGVYLDFGYIRETTVDGETGGGESKTGEMVLMGAGGFLGFRGAFGVNVPFMAGPIPMYFAPEASVDVTLFIGMGADPMNTLASFEKDKEHKGQNFSFNIEVLGTIRAGANIGIGVYKILGGRIYIGIGFDFGYGMNMAKWFPNIGEDWGTNLYFETNGTLDLVITSISLYGASIPVVGSGWLEYSTNAQRANRLVAYVREGIADGEGSAEAREKCRGMADEMADAILNNKWDAQTLKDKLDALLSYAWDQDMIDSTQYWSVYVRSQDGVIGAIIEATLNGETPEPKKYFTRNHVDSEWTAGQDARLMSAFRPVSTGELVRNAFTQTAAQIQPIGGNRYLVVFLDDDGSRDRQQAAALKYTIYNANDGSWAMEPKLLQNDGTADSKPNLIDAGGKLILSWASTTPEKYAALKAAFAAELGVEPDDPRVTAAMEDDPARVMAQMDIFCTEFRKDTDAFGRIEQLTDDEFCDDYPQAVYDEKSGDYIVLYYKTAQEDDAYSDNYEKLRDLMRVSPAPDRTYSVLAYMLYNGEADAGEGYDSNSGEAKDVPAGWVRDFLYENEFDESTKSYADPGTGAVTGLAGFLRDYGGQRFLPSAIRGEDGEMTDPPIVDLTVCNGYNGLASYAFTVDRDFNLGSAEDKELYLQFYRFADHTTYVPVKIAGDALQTFVESPGDGVAALGASPKTYEAAVQVDVGSPRLIRNDGSTWLFWREDTSNLRYINVSELLRDKVLVSADADPGKADNWTYAVREDGSFARDPRGGVYTPKVETVDFGLEATGETMNLTDYQIITDGDDNLYVVWTKNVRYKAQDEVLGTYDATAQEIYAMAKIREEDRAQTQTGGDDARTAAAAPVRWSKPYRLTRDNAYHDGLAIALDDAGGLLILHNQFRKELVNSFEKMDQLVAEGKAAYQYDEEGDLRFVGSMFYDTDVSLMLTRCAAVGSVEVTDFGFSNLYPLPGEEVKVTATVENTGLTTAERCSVDFYECRDGKPVRKLHSTKNDSPLPVNTAREVSFLWTVPEDGAEGCSIQAVAREHKGEDEFDPVETFSEPFTAAPVYRIGIDAIRQNGDRFDVEYHVRNMGNAPAAEGTVSTLRLLSLYGDLKELYGMDDDVLLTQDIAGLAPRETRTVKKSISVPVSVFEFCGYDAVELTICDSEGDVLERTDGEDFIAMDQPMNLRLNGGQTISVDPGQSKAAELRYDATVFIEPGKVVYSVADPDIAAVDAAGNVTGLAAGSTTVTATMMPSGRSASVRIRVGEGCGKDDTCPISAFADADPKAWYHDGVHWALDAGVMNGVGNGRFAPDSATSRAMLVTMLWRRSGEPRSDQAVTFRDVPAGQWYTEAIRWAAENEIVKGYSAEKFGPDDRLTREQMAAILERYASCQGRDVSGGETAGLTGYTDAEQISDWAAKAFRWAVDAGIIQGTTRTTLSPQSNATRAQVATMLMRYDDLK